MIFGMNPEKLMNSFISTLPEEKRDEISVFITQFKERIEASENFIREINTKLNTLLDSVNVVDETTTATEAEVLAVSDALTGEENG